MTIEERASGGVTILDVRGRMTFEVLWDMLLAKRVRQLLKEGHKRILLNLEGVPYVDTTGVCNVVEAYVATRRQNGFLKLLHLTPHVREVLTVTRLLSVFEAYDAEADAVASFGPNRPT